jgi:hypothetical protein
MARAITRDPREYRRGMVLGLTLAETMLLLLFLLMMVVAALLWRAGEEVRGARDARDAAISGAADQARRLRVVEAELRPLLEELARHGQDASSAAGLAGRLDRARSIEAELARQRDALAEAEANARAERAARQRAEAEIRRLREEERRWQPAALTDVLAPLRPIDPSRPPEEVLSELVEVLARQPEAGQPGAVAVLSARLDRAAAAAAEAGAARQRSEAFAREIGALEAEVDRLRRLVAGRGGAGELYPSCWASAGQAEYVFEIVLRNGGQVEVQDLAPAARRTEEPWTRLGPFARGEPVPIETFLAAVRGLAEWSARQRPECRFHVRVRNGLRPGSPMEEYNRVIGPLGNAASRHLPFYRVGG